MPPRLPRAALGRSRLLRLPLIPQAQQICPICSYSQGLRRSNPSKPMQGQQQTGIRIRRQSTLSSAAVIDDTPHRTLKAPRTELRDALVDLQKHAGSYVNISRLQLAIRGLEQKAGQETIRIAILGLADGGKSLQKAKELLRLLVADPLKAEEEWERLLVNEQQGSKPLLLKVGHNGTEEAINGSRLVQELNVSSPMLNGYKLEILVLEMDPPVKAGDEASFTETILVPTMEIPTSNTGRYTPVTTPVHKSLIISEGLLGAASVLNYPIDVDRDIIHTAIDLRIATPDDESPLPCQIINIELGTEALQSFRESVDNALVYEKSWFASGVPEVLEWVKIGTSLTEGSTKLPLKKLVESLLRHTSLAIEAEQSRQLGAALSAKVSSAELQSLREGLSQWAVQAHTELRDQLDIAFSGRRWRKLGWWKLFWRVDDVSMIASDILAQQFLTDAEKEVIFLAGRIVEAGVFKDNSDSASKNWAYKPIEEKPEEETLGLVSPPPQIGNLIESKDHLPVKLFDRPWPLHIPATRLYLSGETIPALQALAQKLLLQTLTTSSLASILGGLMYISSVSTTLYEAGAVAALGIVWSLRRMQGKWETARKFWEGEVREEGRKAVRAVEGVVGDALTASNQPLEGNAELEKAKEAVERAKAALEASK